MSRIKSCYVSRFEGGSIVQGDFSQLEFIGAAYLCKDPTMYSDIRNGTDIHCVGAEKLCDNTYEELVQGKRDEDPVMCKHRSNAKSLNFLIIYGGGPLALSEDTGLPIEVCRDYIEAFYNRYPLLKLWQEDNITAVKASRVLSERRTVLGVPSGRGQLESPTGRLYAFHEYDPKDWQITKAMGLAKRYNKPFVMPPPSFSPPQIKNYPVQGFATGDVVPLMLGKCFRWLQASEFKGLVLPIGTIHDSILWDVDGGDLTVERFSLWAKAFLERTPEFIQETWGFEFDLPLAVDLEAGPTWDSMRRVC